MRKQLLTQQTYDPLQHPDSGARALRVIKRSELVAEASKAGWPGTQGLIRALAARVQQDIMARLDPGPSARKAGGGKTSSSSTTTTPLAAGTTSSSSAATLKGTKLAGTAKEGAAASTLTGTGAKASGEGTAQLSSSSGGGEEGGAKPQEEAAGGSSQPSIQDQLKAIGREGGRGEGGEAAVRVLTSPCCLCCSSLMWCGGWVGVSGADGHVPA